ncbi:TIGR04282 family arsenosugar biosynthesis glycosyltransferase [Tissierella sp. MB52-C2]|uniref:TIGR04282 family arsenosugar biosynthesis glycosyltransferase n=1 Tax=Tissierella sp. MB52-C2 TaxID=3070999 RepID=UPI00280B4B67|nr:TIGR04282 family arsenosugar biosynthesis glycosyltransferase [Tissierella sp. MB52-C2]WMM24623.1 TIGR04282 family arsenosugar biosynthesis glycosyltransferase [Tissierella sp. MB52-C2]
MNALILMTRVPLPGMTKTRLMDIMTGEECANLHMEFLKDLFNTFKALKEDIDIYITYTPEYSLGVIGNIIPNFTKTFPQRGEDLGSKMYNGISHVLNLGYEKVVLIGSDIPHISSSDIFYSFEILDKNHIVLGPSYDGGYYLIGMKTPNKGIFHINKKWGGKSVLESTVDIINSQGLTVDFAPKYMDIDTKEDLFLFMDMYKNNENPIASNTIEFVRRWSGKYDKKQINRTNQTIY